MFEITDVINGKRTIAKIKGGANNDKYVTYADKIVAPDVHNGMDEVVLTGADKFEPVPDVSTERCVGYICGPSGSGKSYFTKMFLRNYIKQYPGNQIYMFSKLADDVSLDDIPEIQRLKIDDRLTTSPFVIDDFKNCLVIFDDIDTLLNKDHKLALDQLKDSILECGRHTFTTILITSHLACKGQATRTIMNEAHLICIFAQSGMPLTNLLSNYMGLSTKQIRTIKSLQTRFISFIRGYPQIIVTEQKVFFMKDLI